jgi:hypothetical protein
MQAMPEEKPLAVDFSQEDALEQILPRPPILSSHEAGWNGILLEYHRQPAYEIPEIYLTRREDPRHTPRVGVGMKGGKREGFNTLPFFI